MRSVRPLFDGAPVTVPILGAAVLTVSTALTYDTDGRCVEGDGLPFDRRIPASELTPTTADRDW